VKCNKKLPHYTAVTDCRKSIDSLGDALSCRASPLQKQSTGLFLNSPLAERFVAICWALPHTPQWLSALDLTKGLKTPLESHYHGYTFILYFSTD